VSAIWRRTRNNPLDEILTAVKQCPDVRGASWVCCYNDPEHWRQRAKEARQLALKMADPVGRSAMLEIADRYERLAVRAIERLAQSGPPNPESAN